MTSHKTKKGNPYYIDGIFAFIELGSLKLTYWESLEELENWVNIQYQKHITNNT